MFIDGHLCIICIHERYLSHINLWPLIGHSCVEIVLVSTIPSTLLTLFQACEELDAAVFIHPWNMPSDGRMSKYWFPWLIGMPSETTVAACALIFGGVLERHPKLKVCLAHGGGSFPFTLGRIAHGFETRPDLCAVSNSRSPTEYLRRIWIDSLTHDEAALKFCIDRFGADRVIMGSDYPFILGEHKPGDLVKGADLPDDVKDKVLCQNAFDLLGLDRKNYE